MHMDVFLRSFALDETRQWGGWQSGQHVGAALGDWGVSCAQRLQPAKPLGTLKRAPLVDVAVHGRDLKSGVFLCRPNMYDNTKIMTFTSWPCWLGCDLMPRCGRSCMPL